MSEITEFWAYAHLHFAGCIFSLMSYIIVLSISHWRKVVPIG